MASGSSSSKTSVKEYTIKVPKNVRKMHHVMKFNATLDVDIEKWEQVKMERENNMMEFKGMREDQPKFGAGSEFGREARHEKLGIISRKYKPDDQPWILKSCGSTVKKYKGIREGGVSENAAYYVFTHGANQSIEAFPLHEWYKFQPIKRYNTLSIEEAEEEFSKRNKHFNFFSLMKRLKGDDDDVLDGKVEEGKSKKGGKSKNLNISEIDEWMDSSDDDSDEEEAPENEEDDEEKPDKKKTKKKDDKKKKHKKGDTKVEAFEDSDDGDGEGRELDYITDSSDSEPENTQLEGVSEEKGLRKLLKSDEESESDSDKSDTEKEKEDENMVKDKKDGEGEGQKDKSKKKKTKKDPKKKRKGMTDSDFSLDSNTDVYFKQKKVQQKKNKRKKGEEKAKPEQVDPSTYRYESPTIVKKRMMPDLGWPPKKAKLEASINIPIGHTESGITEDTVRKYLMRKPMTTTELLQKFRWKKSGLSSEQLVNIMAQILKKINPDKQIIAGKMYLFIKS